MRSARITCQLWAAVLAIAGALAGTVSYAQQVGPPQFPQTLPSNTVVGRVQAGVGPASAIPFSQLGPLLSLQNQITVGTTPVFGGSNGQCLTINGSVVGAQNCGGGGGGSPGGVNTQLQYNNAGSFGGISGVTSNGTSLTAVGVALGSDATGDIYYRNSGGNLARLGIGSSNQVLTVSGGLPSWAASTGAVSSVSNSDGTLTISPTTGSVVASLALGHANTWTAAQTFTNSDLILLGSSTGTTTFTSGNSGSSNFTLTVPAATDQLVARATTDTLTNKTYDTGGTGNVLKINGTQITAISGNTATVASESGTLTSGNCVKSDANHNLVDAATTCGAGTPAKGTFLPSSMYFGAASGNAYPTFYVPATNTNSAGQIEGIGVVASLSADAPVILQFNCPETIPSGTQKLRLLAMANATSGVAKLTVSDGATSAGSNIGATTLNAETQTSQTWTTADILVENKITLTNTCTANQIETINIAFNHTSWTLAAASVWQASMVWE